MEKFATIASAAVTIGNEVWPDWPSMGRFDQYLRAPSADAAPRPAGVRHRWVNEEGSRYRCVGCGKVTTGLSVRLITSRCLGLRAVTGLAAVLRVERGHRLCAVYCGLAQPHIVCLRCGAWARGRPVKLLQGCAGVATTAGRAALRTLSMGRMPGSRGAYEGAYHIEGGTVDFQRALQYV